MIQRIQSLYLFIVLLLSVSLFFIPLYSLDSVGDGCRLVRPGFITSNFIYVLFNSTVGILAAGTIFLFKNRTLQIRLCNLDMLVLCIFIGTIFYFADASKPGAESVVHYNFGCYFPLVQLLLSFLAMRAIRKDEELVRSADRLR